MASFPIASQGGKQVRLLDEPPPGHGARAIPGVHQGLELLFNGVFGDRQSPGFQGAPGLGCGFRAAFGERLDDVVTVGRLLNFGDLAQVLQRDRPRRIAQLVDVVGVQLLAGGDPPLHLPGRQPEFLGGRASKRHDVVC